MLYFQPSPYDPVPEPLDALLEANTPKPTLLALEPYTPVGADPDPLVEVFSASTAIPEELEVVTVTPVAPAPVVALFAIVTHALAVSVVEAARAVPPLVF